jgi:hypothetical protein
VVLLTIALLLAAGPDPASDSDSILDVKLNASSAGAPCTLRGIVTMLSGASEFYLQDDTSGVHVYSPPYSLREGERLEIEGWMYLSDAGEFQVRARRVWHVADGKMPPSRLIRAREALDGTYQGQLVSVRGTVLAVDFGPQYDTVSVQSGRTSLRAFAPANRHGLSVLEQAYPGMQVALTGISVPQTVDPEFDGYQIRLRRPQDLVIRPLLVSSRAPPSLPWAGAGATMLLVVAAAWTWRHARSGTQIQ